jgi:single-stranded-DNA-specific exonuclease
VAPVAHAILSSASSGEAFLGVERSLRGLRWRERPADAQATQTLSRLFRLPDIAARLLAARGVTPEDAGRFLEPKLKDWFPDPSSFADMDLAAEAIEDAIARGRSCAVLADYDVDGATSAAQLIRYFRARGRDLALYVPDRLAEGYGPSALAFERLRAAGVELVITVDCGAAAEGPLRAAAELGLEVVVLDHHLMSGPPPPARAVVNPNRPDCQSGMGALTAAGVVLVTLAAVNRLARKNGSIGSNNLPDPIATLDLAALGTVCDVAPLTGFNRAIVAQGLKILGQKRNPGLTALAMAAGRADSATVYDLGFVLGPRLNAGGRIGEATLATQLLIADDPSEAVSLAERLHALNAERRQIEADIANEAADIAAGDERPVIVVGARHWHPGVIGIVAGRLKERLRKPVIVLGAAGPDEPAKGSGRSISGVNLGRAVAAAARAGVLTAGGGHAMAAGLSMEWSRVEDLRAFLAHELGQETQDSAEEARALSIDALAGAGAVNLGLVDALERIGPFGAGHPEPVLALATMRVSFAKRVGDSHLRVTLADARGKAVRGIAFNCATEPLGEALLQKDAVAHVAVRVKRNSYQGAESAEVEVVDASPAYG